MKFVKPGNTVKSKRAGNKGVCPISPEKVPREVTDGPVQWRLPWTLLNTINASCWTSATGFHPSDARNSRLILEEDRNQDHHF